MKYDKPLPPPDQLMLLAKSMEFPAGRSAIIQAAASLGLPGDVTDFLGIFPAREIFENRVDFMTRCEEIVMLMNQEREMPAETLRSPQD